MEKKELLTARGKFGLSYLQICRYNNLYDNYEKRYGIVLGRSTLVMVPNILSSNLLVSMQLSQLLEDLYFKELPPDCSS